MRKSFTLITPMLDMRIRTVDKLFYILILFMLVSCAAQPPRDGIDGKDGVSIVGPKGDTGEIGPIGNTGPSGPTGAPGQDASSVTPVPLCTGQTTYPTAFAEYGLCIGGSLFGVYWDRTNAWLTILPPGNYTSTSTSVPCTLTVSPNCVVTH